MKQVFSVGQLIEARYKGRGAKFYPGKILAARKQQSGSYVYDITYNDGVIETSALESNIRKRAQHVVIHVGNKVSPSQPPDTITHVVAAPLRRRSNSTDIPDTVATPERMRSNSSGTNDTPDTVTRRVSHQELPHLASYMAPQKRSLNVERSPNKRNQLMTFEEVQRILTNIYNQEQAMRSTTLDIICAYLRGQKVLYVEAKTYCEVYLYTLMLPTISITALCSVLSILLQATSVGAPLVSCLGALNSFLLALITYLKLDGKAEAHRTTAYGYEKLQSFCEFNSGKILLMPTGKSEEEHQTNLDSVDEVIHEIEAKVKEIKETNHFILPEYIRYSYPTLYSMNVFAEVKKLMNKETILINKLKININRSIELENSEQDTTTVEYQKQYEGLQKEQNTALEEIIGYRNTYLEIDDKFNTEIDDNRKRAQARRCRCFTWLKT